MGRDWDEIDLTDAGVIADVLSRQPLVRTVFSQFPSLARVPFLDSHRVGLGAVASSFDRIAFNLMFVIKLNNNLLTRDRAIAAVGDLDPYWLDRAATDLVVTGLAVVLDTGELTLFDSIADRIALPLPSFNDSIANLTSDRLQRAAARVGLSGVGTRKADRAAAMAAFLGDADQVRQALLGLSPDAQQVFDLLQRATIDQLPSSCSTPGAHAPHELLPQELRLLGFSRRVSPVATLSEALLVGSDWNGYEIWIWAETAAAFGIQMTPDWIPPTMPDAVALDPAGPDAIVDTLHTLDEVIAASTATPARGNKSGARRPPVKYWRSIAKSCGLDSELTVRCGSLAIELGLLVPEMGPKTGRGRSATQDCFWVPEPTRLGDFNAQTATQRWAQIVERWLSPDLEPDPQASQCRIMMLSALDHLPEGFGIPAAGLSDYLGVRHSLFAHRDPVDDLADLVRLGVLTSGTAVGLTAAGRALCHSLADLDSLFDSGANPGTNPEAPAVIQADHTVITPAGTSLDTIIGLRRIADPVSSGVVSVWRLSADRLARSAADPDFDPVEFLRSLSSTDLPPGVERFLTDSANAATTITIRATGCVITSTDHAALSDAARHKAAKLEVVAPGVAISPLTEAKVAEVLRGKGVVLTGSRTVGAPIPKPAPSWLIAHVNPDDPRPDVSPLLFGGDPAGTLEALAASMADRRQGDLG